MQGPGVIRLFLQNQTTANKKTRLAMIGYFFLLNQIMKMQIKYNRDSNYFLLKFGSN